MTSAIKLFGRVFVQSDIKLRSGLHIGVGKGGLQIGGLADNAILRDPITNCPYIPGSSLKGKLRSLAEIGTGSEQNWSMNNGGYNHPPKRRKGEVRIHLCKTPAEYKVCPVCPVFGVPGDREASAPTRLTVRDVPMDETERARLEQARTDLPYTEVKWEAVIDRVTSAAMPRAMERVPAGTIFRDAEMVFSIYAPEDISRFKTVLTAMQLLEDDYLGGLGSRGSGWVRFENVTLTARSCTDYGTLLRACPHEDSVQSLLSGWADVSRWVADAIPTDETTYSKASTPEGN